MNVIKRNLYLNQLINRKHNGLIKIISGIRRCGKSYLLFELFKQHLLDNGVKEDHILEKALDGYGQEKYRNPDVYYNYVISQIKDSDMYYVLLDEVQFMEDFVSVLNGFLHIKNLDVYVTESNSKFLSSDVVTEFRGRGDEVRVYPLSFAEYFSVANTDFQTAWKEYVTFGGMPLVLGYNDATDKIKYLQSLFKETYLKDIIDRNNVKNKEELDELVNIVASNIGCLTNPKRLADTFVSTKHVDISGPTITQYLDYLQDAYVINKVMRYDIKGKKYINTPYKYYFADTGLRNARLNFRQSEETHLMENVIYNELNIRGFNVDVGNVEILEKKDSNIYQRKNAEVDFVANLGSKRYYIQSALEMPMTEKRVQEERSLLGIKDFFKKIIIVKNDIIPYQDENGVTIIGLKDFLLNFNSLEF
ncbi:MAG: ATP-binding protein [Alphaproteobacteria bacterium]|nr:ATP-binding protein [Alphaproteobacteria bacterium]